VKHIAKTRPRRLRTALSALASSVRRTIAGRVAGLTRPGRTRTGMGHTTRSMRASTVASRLALVPAHPEHFDWIASTLREAAAEGSFDPELATDSLATHVFFANLRQTLLTGYFLDEKGDGPPAHVAASGYVLGLSSTSRGFIPIGFAMFKAIGGLGFELWLVAVDRRYRGKGFGKAMLQAALGTPAGMLAHVARVNRAGRDCEAMGKALGAAGYRRERDGPDVRWFVREDAPQALIRLVRAGGGRLAET
jgi:ribosomal protein S18 acetylase RimI-like enzyme